MTILTENYSFCQATTNYFSKYYHFITQAHTENIIFCYSEIMCSDWQISSDQNILWYHQWSLLIRSI